MLFRVSFWNDRADTEVFGKTIKAENECEAEGIFFDELEDENDYSDEYPVLVQEIEEKPVKLDFEDLFCKALTKLIENNGGSLDSALYGMGIQFESETGKAIRDWFGWEDEEDEYNFEGTGMSEKDIRDLTIDDMAKMGLYDEEE